MSYHALLLPPLPSGERVGVRGRLRAQLCEDIASGTSPLARTLSPRGERIELGAQ